MGLDGLFFGDGHGIGINDGFYVVFPLGSFFSGLLGLLLGLDGFLFGGGHGIGINDGFYVVLGLLLGLDGFLLDDGSVFGNDVVCSDLGSGSVISGEGIVAGGVLVPEVSGPSAVDSTAASEVEFAGVGDVVVGGQKGQGEGECGGRVLHVASIWSGGVIYLVCW